MALSSCGSWISKILMGRETPFSSDLLDLCTLDEVPHRYECSFAHENLPRRSAVRQTRRQIHVVAQHRVIGPRRRPDVANRHVSWGTLATVSIGHDAYLGTALNPWLARYDTARLANASVATGLGAVNNSRIRR